MMEVTKPSSVNAYLQKQQQMCYLRKSETSASTSEASCKEINITTNHHHYALGNLESVVRKRHQPPEPNMMSCLERYSPEANGSVWKFKSWILSAVKARNEIASCKNPISRTSHFREMLSRKRTLLPLSFRRSTHEPCVVTRCELPAHMELMSSSISWPSTEIHLFMILPPSSTRAGSWTAQLWISCQATITTSWCRFQ